MYDADICHHVCVADRRNHDVAVRKLKYLSRDTVSCCCRDIANKQLQVRLGANVLLGHIHLLRPKMASAERDGGGCECSPLTYIHTPPSRPVGCCSSSTADETNSSPQLIMSIIIIIILLCSSCWSLSLPFIISHVAWCVSSPFLC